MVEQGDEDETAPGRARETAPGSDGPRAEHSLPEPLRRLLEAGLGRFVDRPEQLRQKLAELKLPREAWSAILAQLDDRRSGLYKLVAKEVRGFLGETNFAEQLVRAMTTLSFEIKTEVRFIPNESGAAQPKVSSSVRVKPNEEPKKNQ